MADDALNFPDILDWALAAQAAYESDAAIRDAYGSETWTMTLPDGVKVFVAPDAQRRFQWLSVRGTDDFANVREDADYLKDPDPKLGIYLHNGFRRDADAIYAVARARLTAGLSVRVTGHSLGGAVAAIIHAYLNADGVPVDTAITFGQPKVTNEDGVIKLRSLPVLRVVNDEDIVPMVPPLTLLSALRGPYRHFGQELHLGPQPPVMRLYTEHDAEEARVSGFWDHLGDETPRDHHVALYVAKIQAFKLAAAASPSAAQPSSSGSFS